MNKGAIVNADGSPTGFYQGGIINSDGTFTKFYKGAIIDSSGNAITIYKSAIEWTYSNVEGYSSGGPEDFNYGVSDAYTVWTSISVVGNNEPYGYATYRYTFNQPVTMRTGQTISCVLYTQGFEGDGAGSGYLYINKDFGVTSDLELTMAAWSTPNVTGTYTFSTDTTINYIDVRVRVNCYSSSSSAAHVECRFNVTINSDDGSFLLNNSGTSNQ